MIIMVGAARREKKRIQLSCVHTLRFTHNTVGPLKFIQVNLH